MLTFDILNKRARLSADSVALVDVAAGRALSYRELDDRASRLAESFRDAFGLQSGNRVAILCQHSSEFYEALFACAKTETILVPLNWRLPVAELDGILDDCTPALLIADPMFARAAAELRVRRPGLSVVVLGEEPIDALAAYEPLLAKASGAPVVMPEKSGDAVWYLLYTSGTTGKPKGVIQTFSMALANYLNIGVPCGFTAADKTLNLLPQFHAGGINLFTLPTLIVGGTAVIQRSFDPAETMRVMFEERITGFFGVPAVYLMLSQHPDFETVDLSRVRVWASGGAPMPVSLLEQYAERGIVIRQGFGMTETGPTVFLVDEAHALSKAGSVGKPQLYVEVRIIDAKGRDVTVGEMGELLVKGPGVTPGYWGRDDLTAQAFTKDGWLYSGDIARVDADGYYYIVDRSKDMYISGGENVYPAEIENVLFQHPAVKEVAVVGLPDPKWGESGLAVVALKAGRQASESELLQFCGSKLARYKIPKAVAFVESLPRNAAGKVVKPDLRKAYSK